MYSCWFFKAYLFTPIFLFFNVILKGDSLENGDEVERQVFLWLAHTSSFCHFLKVYPKPHPPNVHHLPHCPHPPCFLHLCHLHPSLWHLLNTSVCPLLGSDCELRCLSPLSLWFICQLFMCLSWLIPGASAHAFLDGQSYRSYGFGDRMTMSLLRTQTFNFTQSH